MLIWHYWYVKFSILTPVFQREALSLDLVWTTNTVLIRMSRASQISEFGVVLFETRSRRFESRPAYRLFWLKFLVVSIGLSRKLAEYCWGYTTSRSFQIHRNSSLILQSDAPNLVWSRTWCTNSYLFIYNTFIKILYMFRALPCSSSGLHRNCIYAASGIVTVCRWLSPTESDDTRGCIYTVTM
jgi:hypothetical protein